MRPAIARYVGPFVYRLDEQRDQSLTFTPGYGEFVPPGRILPWDLALLAEKPG